MLLENVTLCVINPLTINVIAFVYLTLYTVGSRLRFVKKVMKVMKVTKVINDFGNGKKWLCSI